MGVNLIFRLIVLNVICPIRAYLAAYSTVRNRCHHDKMNKQQLLRDITETVRKKHPWRISQDRYFNLFGRFPQEFLDEKLAYDNLIEKTKTFRLCNLILSQVKVEILLTLDECIAWELSLDKWEEARKHDILPSDIKKLLKND